MEVFLSALACMKVTAFLPHVHLTASRELSAAWWPSAVLPRSSNFKENIEVGGLLDLRTSRPGWGSFGKQSSRRAQQR